LSRGDSCGGSPPPPHGPSRASRSDWARLRSRPAPAPSGSQTRATGRSRASLPPARLPRRFRSAIRRRSRSAQEPYGWQIRSRELWRVSIPRRTRSGQPFVWGEESAGSPSVPGPSGSPTPWVRRWFVSIPRAIASSGASRSGLRRLPWRSCTGTSGLRRRQGSRFEARLADEPLADRGRDVGRSAGPVHVDDGMAAGNAHLAVADDLPAPRQRRPAELPKANANVDLFVEPEHAQVVRLHAAPRI